MNFENQLNGPSSVLKHSRERAGEHYFELAHRVGLPVPAYLDLEAHDNDIMTAVSLRHLSDICAKLALTVFELFAAVHSSGKRLPGWRSLASELQTYLRTNGLSLAEFETVVGYEISSALTDPDAILDWNLDCLRSVCISIGVDWKTAFPTV
jgi:hypothetical protein